MLGKLGTPSGIVINNTDGVTMPIWYAEKAKKGKIQNLG